MKIITSFSNNQRGAVLIIVLWVIMLLSMLLATYSRNIKVETEIVKGIVSDVNMHAVASGVVSYIAKLKVENTEAFSSILGDYQEITLGTQTVAFNVIPEESYVSINNATLDLLSKLISGVADNNDINAKHIAAAIIDWRDTDEIIIDDIGAEKTEYDEADLSWKPSNSNFESISELRFVMGVTSSLLNYLKPHISLYSESELVNSKYASSALIELLGGDQSIDVNISNNTDDLLSEDTFFAENQSDLYRIKILLIADDVKLKHGLEVVVSFGSKSSSFELKESSSLYHIKQWNRYTADFDNEDE